MNFALILLYEKDQTKLESLRFAFPQKTTGNQQQEIQFLPLGGTGVNGMLCDNLIRLFLSTARGKLQHLLKFKDLINVNKYTNIRS